MGTSWWVHPNGRKPSLGRVPGLTLRTGLRQSSRGASLYIYIGIGRVPFILRVFSLPSLTFVSQHRACQMYIIVIETLIVVQCIQKCSHSLCVRTACCCNTCRGWWHHAESQSPDSLHMSPVFTMATRGTQYIYIISLANLVYYSGWIWKIINTMMECMLHTWKEWCTMEWMAWMEWQWNEWLGMNGMDGMDELHQQKITQS